MIEFCSDALQPALMHTCMLRAPRADALGIHQLAPTGDAMDMSDDDENAANEEDGMAIDSVAGKQGKGKVGYLYIRCQEHVSFVTWTCRQHPD